MRLHPLLKQQNQEQSNWWLRYWVRAKWLLIPPGHLNLRLCTQGSLPCRVTGPDKGPELSVRPESTAAPDNEQRWSVYPRGPCGSLNVGTDLPTETKLSKVSSITSRYSVLSMGPSSRHSSWLKSTATSWKVTGSYIVIQVWCLSKGQKKGHWEMNR